MDFGFLALKNSALFLLLPLVLLLIIWRGRERLRRIKLLGLSKAFKESRGVFLPLLLILIIGLALIRPYFGHQEQKLKHQGRDVVLALDVSLSMLAKDLPPNRLQFAQHKLLDLIDLAESDQTNDRFALIIFAGNAALACPLTSDYEVLRNYLRALDSSLVTEGGSRVDRALNLAADLKQAASSDSLSVFLLTDGEDDQSDLSGTLKRLKQRDIPIFALGIGTVAGQPIPLSDGRFVTDQAGRIVVSKMNPKLLGDLAQLSGGAFQSASLKNSDIRNFWRATAPNEALQDVPSQSYGELGPWLCGLAGFYIALVLARGRFAWLFPCILALVILGFRQVYAEDSQYSPTQAWQAYESGDFAKAERAFQQLLEEHPSNRKYLQGWASAKYKVGDFLGAAKLFQSLAQGSTNGREKYQALYNLGNSEVLAGNLDQGIESYRAALRIKPDDKPAQDNLEAALKLKEDRQSLPPQSKSSNSSNADSSHESGSQSSEKASSQSNSSAQTSSEAHNSAQANAVASQAGQNSSSAYDNNGSSESSKPSQNERSSVGQSESASAAATPQDDTTKDNLRQRPSETALNRRKVAPDRKREYDPEELKREQAQEWLDSLPDSPLLFSKRSLQSNDAGEQRW